MMFATVASVAMFVAAPVFGAPAQQPADAILQSTPSATVLRNFATCVVERRPERVRALLSGFPGGLPSPNDRGQLDDAHRGLVDSYCLQRGQVSLRMRGHLLWYALAEAYVRQQVPATVTDFSGVALLEHPAVALQQGAEGASSISSGMNGDFAADRDSALLSRFGECVARFDTPNSRRLIMAELAEERAVIGEMMPALEACLPDGVSLGLTPLAIRGSVALGYARLAIAASEPGQPEN